MVTATTNCAVSFDDVAKAASALDGIAHQTPVLTSRSLNELVHASVYLKCENLQRVGAFKFRGAYNALSNLSSTQRHRGVVTHSSGNHGQALALAGKILGCKTVVVMPTDAPMSKRLAAKNYGADITLHERGEVRREDVSAELVAKHGYQLIPPYDDHHVIAGQGTSAAEFHRQVKHLDTLLVPCGGGGLLSGSAIATRNLAPDCQIIGVEPLLGDDAARSFKSKKIQRVENPQTIADGTRTESLGELTFPLILNNVDDIVTVSEAAIANAVTYLLTRTKILVEPSGALGIAALMSGAVKDTGRTGVILSGGNIDPETLSFVMKTAKI